MILQAPNIVLGLFLYAAWALCSFSDPGLKKNQTYRRESADVFSNQAHRRKDKKRL
ncbi:hypothetical protein HCH_07079 [Hahella chejuensis KCTC 2396]|uniref:Uncharacterized protein n=1 Tax=Hahella chejuensis (strain KCTC 2396) TaxID=349521 RepID=Q2S6N3_HAHCH|nr:hypothetical protein HCH_07079 [Hahella chejuensis KCTC 2396]